MSYRKLQIIQNHLSSPFFIPEPSIFPFYPSLHDQNDPTFSLLDFPNSVPDSVFNSVLTESIPAPFCSHRVNPAELTCRVKSLESRFDRLLQLNEREHKMLMLNNINEVDRKYTWTAEIKGGGIEKKYKWTAEIERNDREKMKRGERKYEWSSEIKCGGSESESEKRVYTWKSTIGGEDEKKKKKIGKGKGKGCVRIVEIGEACDDHRCIVLRQAFAKRTRKDKGKKKELSPFDAAALIQLSFRNYLIRRSKALRALRELAVAKTKLKELREKFHNFSYRSRVSHDAEERQKFSEKIIVLLLTVDAIEGVDLMVRAAKRSMVDELEAMLDVVDPQPGMRSVSMRRRTFDMPSGTIQKEIAEGVAQVVQMLDEENGTFEACL